MQNLQNDWKEILQEEFQKPYFNTLMLFLQKEYQTHRIYPEKEELFNALYFTCFKRVKVVILGQDPYHGKGLAHGLSFSVNKNVPIPPSLKNIFKELSSDLAIEIPRHGYLKKWALEGVLLLNAVMSVREGCPNSHKGKGWETFTDAVIKKLNERADPVVFLFWGNHARAKKKWVVNQQHFVIESAHPSPLSAHGGFFGSAPFSKINQFLITQGKSPIDWRLSEEI